MAFIKQKNAGMNRKDANAKDYKNTISGIFKIIQKSML